MNTKDLLQTAIKKLNQAGCGSPRLDAELLLMHVWQVGRTGLIIRANEVLPETVAADFDALMQRRMNREPLAYITGEKEFWSHPFAVTHDVLIPRPETEHLIEAVLQRFPDRATKLLFCDIGTGSGCIAVTLACEYPRATVVASDISGAALNVARRNAEQMGVANRLDFRQADMLTALSPDDDLFHAIISNPPYVAEHEMAALEPELTYEPRSALTDEQNGLGYLTTILRDGSEYLRPDGYIILETGLCGLPETPADLICDELIHDLAGHLRGGVYHRSIACF